ncbi:MAG: methyl-accepting chemotaxis protein [Verrucomicrobiota bacterium]
MVLSKLTIGNRLSIGFATLLMLMLIVGGVCYAIMSQATGLSTIVSEECGEALEIAEEVLTSWTEARANVEKYIITGQDKFREKADTYLVEVKKGVDHGIAAVNKFTHLPKVRKDIEIMDNSFRRFSDEYQKIIQVIDKKNKSQTGFAKTEKLFVEDLEAFISYERGLLTSNYETLASSELARIMGLISSTALLEKEAASIYAMAIHAELTHNVKELDEAANSFVKVERGFKELESGVQTAKGKELLGVAKQHMNDYKESLYTLDKLIHELYALEDSITQIEIEFTNAAIAMEKDSIDVTHKTIEEEHQLLSVGKNTVVFGLIISVVIGIVCCLLISRSVTGPIKKLIGSLRDASETTASAARELTSSSTTLADQSSQQAASLEETSASVEEMSSITKCNAETCVKSKTLSAQAVAAAQNGLDGMGKLNQGVATIKESTEKMNSAMDSIKEASGSISKVIKTIDEIAFQTNILALNAAVEAARAGDAGLGFAVVADEVRGLAQRSAEAAKETALLIEDSIEKSDRGQEVCILVNQNLQTIADNSSKVSKDLDEISSKVKESNESTSQITDASREQEAGISQLNNAITEIDSSTQQNAASAEETASSANVLQEQARELKTIIAELEALVTKSGVRLEQGHSSSLNTQNGEPSNDGKSLSLPSTQSRQVTPIAAGSQLDDSEFF